MNEDYTESAIEKATAFFKRAEDVADTDNFDYAIDLYLEGLRFWPDALHDGHAPLRRIALIRQGKGGRKPTMVEKMKHRGGKTPLDEMLNAEFLLAKDPDCLCYAEIILKAAVAGTYHQTADWIAQLVFDANCASEKPSIATFLLLKDSYAAMGMFTKAVAACQKALELKPTAQMKDQLRDLSAQMTVEKGKYGQGPDFRGSILEREKQERLHWQENVVKTERVRHSIAEQARKDALAYPSPTNILKLADALADLQTQKEYDEAINLLAQQYSSSKDFTFRKKQGEIKIKKLKNDIRQLKAELERQVADEEKSNRLSALESEMDKVELEHYRLCTENYPLDFKLKYQYGKCLLKNSQYDSAIPLFQDAQKDPGIRLAAMDKTGLCFFLKGWFSDAVDIFEQALKECQVKDSAIAKDIRYNLAGSYQAAGRSAEALETFRKLAQLDFGFRDVAARIEELRKSGEK